MNFFFKLLLLTYCETICFTVNHAFGVHNTNSSVGTSCEKPNRDLEQHLHLQYQFWGPAKKQRKLGGFSVDFVRNVYEPLDVLDNAFQLVQIARGLGLQQSSYENLTNIYCDHVAEVLLSTIQIGMQSSLHGYNYTDPFVVQNYVFFSTYSVTSFQTFFNVVTQKNTIYFNYNMRYILVAFLPGFLTSVSLNLWCLGTLLKSHDSSAFVMHIAVQVVDAVLYFVIVTLAFPFELIAFQGDTCKHMQTDWVRTGSEIGPAEISFRAEEMLGFIKYILLTTLIADRTMSISVPVWYSINARATNAGKLVYVIVAISFPLSLATFANYWWLHGAITDGVILVVTVVVRSTIGVVLFFLSILQVVLPVILSVKLFTQWQKKKTVTGKKHDSSKYLFLFFNSVYNLATSLSTSFMFVLELLLQLRLLQICNRCPVLLYNAYSLLRFMELCMGALQPTSSSVSFILHLMFLKSYRRVAAKILHVDTITNVVRKCLMKLIVFVGHSFQRISTGLKMAYFQRQNAVWATPRNGHNNIQH